MNRRFKVENEIQQRWGGASRALAWPSLLLLAACSGDLGTSEVEEEPAAPSAPMETPPPTPAGPAVDPPPPAPNGWEPPKLGDSQKYSPIRRLTSREYERTVKQAFGATELDVPRLPEDEDNGILRDPEAKPLADYDAYVEAAMASGAQLAPALVPGCDWQADVSTCVQSELATKLETLYRSPIEAADTEAVTQAIQGAFDRNLDPEIAVSQGIARALLDSRFIYQIEKGNMQLTPEDGVGLTGFETAARLSYFLLDAPPDAALLDAARGNALDTPEARQAQLERIFTPEAAGEAIWRFARNWLRLANSTEISTSLEESMIEETRLFVKYILADEKAPFSDLLSANYSFINAELAEFYGVPAPATDWERYEFPEDSQRRGVLTHASFLSANGDEEKRDVSWIFRGKVLYEHLFCGHLVPPGDPALIEKPVEDRTQDQQCKGCHSILDPAGKLFDSFDSHGKLVTDGAVPGPVLLHSDIDQDYNNFAEFADAAKMSQTMTHCFTRVWLRDALGREPSSADQASFDAAWAVFRETGSVRQMLSSIVAQPSFTTFYPRPSDMVCQ